MPVGRGFLRHLRLHQHHHPARVIFQGDDFRFSKAIACVLEVPAPDLGKITGKSLTRGIMSPGGSLQACMKMCPKETVEDYKTCVKECLDVCHV